MVTSYKRALSRTAGCSSSRATRNGAKIWVFTGRVTNKDGDSFVRESAARALGEIGDAHTLPRIILADSRLSAPQRAAILEKLRGTHYNIHDATFHHAFSPARTRTSRYRFPKTRTLCKIVLEERDIRARKGARAVLDWLDRDELTRPWQGAPTADLGEHLRASQKGADGTPPEPPPNAETSPTLWKRLLGLLLWLTRQRSDMTV